MSMPRSLPFSNAITSCRVSRSLLLTRTVSPCMDAWAFFGVFKYADDLFGLLGRNALLEVDLLAHARSSGRLKFAISERFERDATLNQLVRQDFLHGFQLVLVGGGELDGVVAFELDFRVRVLQVEARAHFLDGLLDGVAHFLYVHFTYDVEGVVCCHNTSLYFRLFAQTANLSVPCPL